MASFRPRAPFSCAMVLLVPENKNIKGVVKKYFPSPDKGIPFNGSFKTYGGTEREINGLYSVEDTAAVVTWYKPSFSSGCRVYVKSNKAMYEIVGAPENIDLRNQYITLKLLRVKGDA